MAEYLTQLTKPPNTIGAIGFLLLFFFGPVHSDPEFSRSGIEQFELKIALEKGWGTVSQAV